MAGGIPGRLRQLGLSVLTVGAVLGGLSCGDNLGPPSTGSIEISTSTAGPGTDADGYVITIDEGSPTAIDANASLRRDNIEPGTHTVRLAGIAANCTAAGENPRPVVVQSGTTAPVPFTITCAAPVDLTGNRIAFLADGNVASVRENGSNYVMLTRDDIGQYDGASPPLQWSPDGTRLLTQLTRVQAGGIVGEAVIVAGDGSGYRTVASVLEWGLGVGTWSPDGSRISYYEAHQAHLADTRLYIAGADGGEGVQLVTDTVPFTFMGYHDFSPAWSPDGDEIAFLSDRAIATPRDYRWRLFVANIAGSLAQQLSPIEMTSFEWAPDGRRLAVVEGLGGSSYGNIFLLDRRNGISTRLSGQDNVDANPVWSPDGSRLAFPSIRDGNAEIYVMNSDGSGVRRLTSDPANDTAPAWSPDGTHLAFQTDRDGNWEIYTVAVDGAGLTNLTRSPGQETTPAWR